MRGLLQKLAKANYIETREGLNGGVRLIIPPKKINIKDIIEVFQGHFQLIDCKFKEKMCENIKACSFKTKMNKVEKTIKHELEQINIKELLS